MVTEAPGRPMAYFTDGARGSRKTKGLVCRWLPHILVTKVPMVPEAPARPRAEVPMVAEAPARPRAYFADGARGSRTSKHQGVDGARGSRTTKGQGPRLPMVPKAPAHRSTEVPMAPEAPARPRAYPRLPYILATEVPILPEAPAHPSHQGADGARESRTTKGLFCRWCPRLPQDQGLSFPMVPKPLTRPRLPTVSEAPAHLRLPHILATEVPILPEAPAHPSHQDGARGSRKTKGLVCRWCQSLSHDQGPRLPMVPEVPAHPSTKVSIVLEAPARPRA
ncbi:hypothetical protein V6Z12_D08G096600 [Gossypium hirsutum]